MDPDRPLIPAPPGLLEDTEDYLQAIWDGWDDIQQKSEFCQKALVLIARYRDLLSRNKKNPDRPLDDRNENL